MNNKQIKEITQRAIGHGMVTVTDGIRFRFYQFTVQDVQNNRVLLDETKHAGKLIPNAQRRTNTWTYKDAKRMLNKQDE